MAETIADKLSELTYRLERMPLFSIADLRLLAQAVRGWQEVVDADGTAVAAELERLIEAMCQTMDGIA